MKKKVKNKLNYSMIEEDILNFFKEHLKKNISKDHFDLNPYQLGMDSLDIVEMITYFDEKYDLNTNSKDIFQIDSLQDYINLLYKQLENK